ncbi:MAG: ATP synthase F1 subunit gamma [Sedimentisphaerales bacterium]|nr:ATP synthase F1 subunit gamma [Sedimentisphaerales bacterium]
MATTREIVKRRRSVGNIRKITKTMEMIATAKFRKALNRAVGSKPYTQKITELASALAAGLADQTSHPLLQRHSESNRVVLLALTSNRGLCGGYNGNVIRLTGQQIRMLRDEQTEIDLRVSGKKGIYALRFMGHSIQQQYTHFEDKVTFAQVADLAEELMDLYCRKQIDGVRVVFTRFVSSARHYADVLNLLPIQPAAPAAQTPESAGHPTGGLNIEEYLFSPPAREILDELIPITVKTELFQCVMDSVVSEQVARMSAMKAATDNAQQMIQALTRQYNRARQSQITSELLDILGGVEALK